MNWIKVVTGFVLMAGVLIGWYRLMKHLKGDGGGSGMKLDIGRGKRGRADAANELERFVATHRAGVGTTPPSATVVEAAPATAPPIATDPVAGPVGPTPAATMPATAPRPLLSGPGRLAFLVFRTALPDHHVFARVALGEVVADAGIARGHVFELVVCRTDLAIVAVADLRSADGLPPAVASTIARSGLRHIVLDPARLPRRDAVRPLLGLD